MIRLAPLLALCLALPTLPALPALAQEAEILPEAEQAQWNAVGRVNVAGFDRVTMCTGTLVAPDLVLTAAHCLYRGRIRAEPGDVHFVAGWRGGDYVAHGRTAEFLIDPDYRPGQVPVATLTLHDTAFLRLAEPIPAAAATPLGLADLPEPAPELAIVGYRRDRPHALSRQAPCQVTARHPAEIGLDCAVIPGASGAPVLWQTPEGWRVVALVAASVLGADPVNAVAPLVPLEPPAPAGSGL